MTWTFIKSVLLPFLVTFVIVVLPWILTTVHDRRVKRQRQAAGLPPVKLRSRVVLGILWTVVIIGAMGWELTHSLWNWKVHENVRIANSQARLVSLDAVYALSEMDVHGEELPDGYIIGCYADTGTTFADTMHQRAAERGGVGGQPETGWYAVKVRIRNNSLEDSSIPAAWYSTSPLTLDDLHFYDDNTQHRQANHLGTSWKDVTGYYAYQEKKQDTHTTSP